MVDQCIDQAQLVAFQCRQDAIAQVVPTLMQCRRSFRLCARTCGPAVPPNPDGVKQCKLNAVMTHLDCKASCQENAQLLTDACLNRDHVCVEECRAGRDGCAQPVLDQLARDVATCNSSRDDDLRNCANLYGEGTPERAQCIQNTQAAAFECRDQARENAWAGLNSCRWNFRTCAQSCPPAT